MVLLHEALVRRREDGGEQAHVRAFVEDEPEVVLGGLRTQAPIQGRQHRRHLQGPRASSYTQCSGRCRASGQLECARQWTLGGTQLPASCSQRCLPGRCLAEWTPPDVRQHVECLGKRGMPEILGAHVDSTLPVLATDPYRDPDGELGPVGGGGATSRQCRARVQCSIHRSDARLGPRASGRRYRPRCRRTREALSCGQTLITWDGETCDRPACVLLIDGGPGVGHHSVARDAVVMEEEPRSEDRRYEV